MQIYFITHEKDLAYWEIRTAVWRDKIVIKQTFFYWASHQGLHMTYKVEICDMIQIYLRSIPGDGNFKIYFFGIWKINGKSYTIPKTADINQIPKIFSRGGQER